MVDEKKKKRRIFRFNRSEGQVAPSVRGRENLTIQQARQISGRGGGGDSGLIRDPKDIESVRFNIGKQRGIDAEQRRQEGIGEAPQREAPFGRVGEGLDILGASLGQPLGAIRALVDPRVTIQQHVNQFFAQSSPKQILDLGLTGLSIGGAGLTLKAFTTGGKFAITQGAKAGAKVGAKVAGRGSTAVITRTATTITQNPVTIATQRAFQVTGKTSVKLATQMSKLGQATASNIVKQGIGLAWRFKGRTLAIGTAVTGAQMLMVWFAIDNVMTGASIYSRDTATAVRFGTLSRGDGIAGLDEAQRRVNQAKRFVNIQLLNPLIAIFSRNIRNGMAQTQAQLDLQYRLLGVER